LEEGLEFLGESSQNLEFRSKICLLTNRYF
jgi:hypothetical protein